jgi:MFS family permease
MQTIQLRIAQRFPALASRDFTLFWIGHLLSLIGTSMQNTAQPLLAYRLSGRPFDLGLIGFAAALPTFFLALPGGVLIEHVDKRKAVIVLQFVMMLNTFAMAWLTLNGSIQIWHIVLLTLVLGIATAFEITARQAMLIELVGSEALPNAIGCNPLPSTWSRAGSVAGGAVPAAVPRNGEGWVFSSTASVSSPSSSVCFSCAPVTTPAFGQVELPLKEFREAAGTSSAIHRSGC